MLSKKPIILGSASPRRKSLLQKYFTNISVEPINADETVPTELKTPEEIVQYLAEHKANNYIQDLKDSLLITADTIVWKNNQILDKPKNELEARITLNELSGSSNEVYTGVCIISAAKKVVFNCKTEVHFKKLNDQEIDFYLANFNALDKAGAYGIQEWIGEIAVRKINGSYTNVVGLPLAQVIEHLNTF